MKLTQLQFEAIIADKKRGIYDQIQKSTADAMYRDVMEDIIFQDEDITDDFLADIKESWDCSDFDENDLISWIRDIQWDVLEETAISRCVSLERYIVDRYDNNKALFAEKQGVKPQQVTQWINKQFIVVDNKLYSERRELRV